MNCRKRNPATVAMLLTWAATSSSPACALISARVEFLRLSLDEVAVHQEHGCKQGSKEAHQSRTGGWGKLTSQHLGFWGGLARPPSRAACHCSCSDAPASLLDFAFWCGSRSAVKRTTAETQSFMSKVSYLHAKRGAAMEKGPQSGLISPCFGFGAK